jgi:hypothetical protein
MISVLGLPFAALTNCILSATLTTRQGRREWGNDLSLPPLVSSFHPLEYGIYAITRCEKLTITSGLSAMHPQGTWTN